MKRLFFLTALSILCLQGCTTGELRAFDDALSRQNGYEVTYPDQSETQYAGEIKWVTGVRNGQGFQNLINTGDQYCRVRVEYEEGDYDYFNLSPRKQTGSIYTNIYNQPTTMDTLCGPTHSTFYESF